VGTVQGRLLSDLLRIEGLTVRYGAALVLNGLDLAVGEGEMFVLLGGSGSGKTTLLRAIAGFVQPEAGRILLAGRDLTALPPHRRPVNTMFQSYALFPHMSVARNIAFGLGRAAGRDGGLGAAGRDGGLLSRLRQRGRMRVDHAARVAEMLALVRLEGYGRRRPHQLSGGQQQRVALARCLAPNPALLLLDEPLSALDRGLRAETRAELVRLRKRLGTTFILVTHNQEEALSMADRLGVMHDGRMLQIGTPAEVYERPNSRYVAEFLGAANILPGTLGPDGVTLDGLGLTLPIGAPGMRLGPVLVGVRPERLRLGPGANALTGRITESAYAGDSITLIVRLPDGRELRVSQSLHNGLGYAAARVGDTVTVSWPSDACMLLPPMLLPPMLLPS
jgi:ABC-type Fe3+/spermidine/putrescine transport system ATPase subunit